MLTFLFLFLPCHNVVSMMCASQVNCHFTFSHDMEEATDMPMSTDRCKEVCPKHMLIVIFPFLPHFFLAVLLYTECNVFQPG